MSDQILDSTQLISGAAILLSFFAGYKYGNQSNKNNAKASSSFNKASYSDHGNYKMILVVRNDLKMGKGKIAAQCGHGAVGAYQQAVKQYPNLVREWEKSGCAKIAVKVESKEELLVVRRAAKMKNFNFCVIRDAGRTQIEPNSMTVLAIGPANSDELNEVTGHLKLL